MRIIKFGIACAILTGASVFACGGSSSSDAGNAAAGASSAGRTGIAGNSSAAGRSNSGGSSAQGGSANRGGATSTGSGGACTMMLNPGQACPALASCIDTKCKGALDACTSPSGVCGSYMDCANGCQCEQACTSNCTQSTACMGCLQTYAGCVQSSCATAAFSCLGAGAGGAFASLDGGSRTCADLSACCGTLTDANTKALCAMVAGVKNDPVCSLSYSALCPG